MASKQQQMHLSLKYYYYVSVGYWLLHYMTVISKKSVKQNSWAAKPCGVWSGFGLPQGRGHPATHSPPQAPLEVWQAKGPAEKTTSLKWIIWDWTVFTENSYLKLRPIIMLDEVVNLSPSLVVKDWADLSPTVLTPLSQLVWNLFLALNSEWTCVYVTLDFMFYFC